MSSTGYTVKAIIRQPSRELSRAVKAGEFADAHHTRNKGLVIGLSRLEGPDDTYLDPLAEGLDLPQRPSKLIRDLPDTNYGVHELIRKQASVTYNLQAEEIGAWDKSGFYFAYVVTGYMGEAIPAQHVAPASGSDWHSSAMFGRRKLGRVGLTAAEDSYRLSIDHAKIDPDPADQVTVHSALMFDTIIDSLEVVPALDRRFQEWQFALNGLRDRVFCDDCRNSHFEQIS